MKVLFFDKPFKCCYNDVITETGSKIMAELCPCGSEKEYSSCCEPLIKGERTATNPLELLRSRYTAHVKGEVDYIINTVLPSKRKNHKVEGIKKWINTAEWLGLKVVNAPEVALGATEGKVEFIAEYREKLRKIDHHEIASFKKENGVWYFDDSEFPFQQVINEGPKVGRNDPCPCGSGKKYKKCCGA